MTPSTSALSISQPTHQRPPARPHPSHSDHRYSQHQHHPYQHSALPHHRPYAGPARPPSPPYAESSAPMSIPRARAAVPPPLPPPSHLPDLSAGRDLGWQWANEAQRDRPHHHSSIRAGSSLLGGSHPPAPDACAQHQTDFRTGSDQSHYRRERTGTVIMSRDHPASGGRRTPSDDGMTTSSASSNYRLHGERHLEQRTREESLQTYDKQLLSRIGGPNTVKPLEHVPGGRERVPIKPLVVVERRPGPSDSPRSAPWPLAPSGPTSPGFTAGHWPADNGLLRCAATNRSANATRQGSLNLDDGMSQRGSYDPTVFSRDDSMDRDCHPLGALHLHDRSPPGHDDSYPSQRAGVKRRASSPPRELLHEDRSSVSSISANSDAYSRRSAAHLPTRTSPNARAHPCQSSFSSASSFDPRHSSLGSSLGPGSMVSSATSYHSGRHSPTSFPVNSCAVDVAEASPRTGGSRGGLIHPQSMYICECCPKKPKKFDTEEELRLHESEKQYTCAYCANRFKNKNEAERHQNSLHLRRHSWSCAALSTVEAAFHASPTGRETDLCGFCGQEFSNPPQWDVRAEHLNHIHKFGECNQSKKFFRADHFRQHLKHSHAGTSGKWTNMLENACMQEEAMPEKRPTAGCGAAASAPQRLMMNTALPTRSAHGLAHGHLNPEGPTR